MFNVFKNLFSLDDENESSDEKNEIKDKILDKIKNTNITNLILYFYSITFIVIEISNFLLSIPNKYNISYQIIVIFLILLIFNIKKR